MQAHFKEDGPTAGGVVHATDRGMTQAARCMQNEADELFNNHSLPEATAHRTASCKLAKERGRWLRMPVMKGRAAMAEPSTTSMTTIPAKGLITCTGEHVRM